MVVVVVVVDAVDVVVVEQVDVSESHPAVSVTANLDVLELIAYVLSPAWEHCDVIAPTILVPNGISSKTVEYE